MNKIVENKTVDYAAQVALEFLRANPLTDAGETAKNFNKVFNEVYRGIAEIVKSID